MHLKLFRTTKCRRPKLAKQLKIISLSLVQIITEHAKKYASALCSVAICVLRAQSDTLSIDTIFSTIATMAITYYFIWTKSM
jgi:hypothetical protein